MAFDYIQLVAKYALEGDRRYAEAIREMVRRSRPELVDAVSENAFTEPLLYAAFSSASAPEWLEQLLCGYFREGPAADGRLVSPGPQGFAYVPCVGTWAISPAGGIAEARWSAEDERLHLYAGGRRVDRDFQPRRVLGPADTELVEGGHPLFQRFYDESPRFKGLVDTHEGHLARALAVIAEIAPRYAEPLFSMTRKVVLHHGVGPNSFATPGAHGAVFLNAAFGEDEVFFVEDLVHQGGHVLFSAASFDRERWFCVDRDTPLGEHPGAESDRRSLYVALHGVFTEAAIVDVLDAWYTAGGLSPSQQHELEGRLAFSLQRLALDLHTLGTKPVFDAEGLELLRALAQVWRDVSARRRHLLNVRFDNQGYNFDYERYRALNRPRVPTSS